MAYNKGNAHRIASMAYLACESVSPRDAYLPMSAEYSVSGRSYTITAYIYAAFSDRMNLYLTYKNTTIGGNNKGNILVNGWVSTDPGYLLATQTFTGTFDDNGVPNQRTWNIGGSAHIDVWNNVGCTTYTGYNLSNSVSLTIDNIAPSYTPPATPSATAVSATDTRIMGTMSVSDFGVGGSNALYVQASKTNFGTVVATSNSLSARSGNYTLTNLFPNTKYYIKPVASNAGYTTTGTVINKVTLASSSISNVDPIDSETISVSFLVNNGGAVYNPTTYIDISTDGTNWDEEGSSTSKSTGSFVVDGLTENTNYYLRLRTVTTAGTFTSAIQEFKTPSHVIGSIVDMVVNGENVDVTVTATSDACDQINAKIYYRIAGMEEPWGDYAETNFESGETATVSISGLVANYVDYELYAKFTDCADHVYDSDIKTFTTVPGDIENRTCESLNIMAQYVCQSLKAIKEGNLKVMANNDTKKWCEEDDDDTPTHASIYSRIQRFMHGIGCVVCSMEGFLELNKASSPNQVFMGKIGWTDMATEAVEGSQVLIDSDAAKRAIDDLIHRVWHFVDKFEYFAVDMADLTAQTGMEEDDVAIIGNNTYKWNGSAWIDGNLVVAENFGVIHIKKGKYADQAFYWFVDSWNRLNLDLSEIEERLSRIDGSFMQSFDGEGYNMAIVGSEWPEGLINYYVPTSATKDTVVVVVDNQLMVDIPRALVRIDGGSGSSASITVLPTANTRINYDGEFYGEITVQGSLISGQSYNLRGVVGTHYMEFFSEGTLTLSSLSHNVTIIYNGD